MDAVISVRENKPPFIPTINKTTYEARSGDYIPATRYMYTYVPLPVFRQLQRTEPTLDPFHVPGTDSAAVGQVGVTSAITLRKFQNSNLITRLTTSGLTRYIVCATENRL